MRRVIVGVLLTLMVAVTALAVAVLAVLDEELPADSQWFE